MPIIAQDSPYRGWAMQGEAMLVLTLMVFAAGVAIVIFVLWLNRRHARARQRLDLLGEALENPQLDEQTRGLILSVLANEHEASRLRSLISWAFWQRVVVAGGWFVFAMFGGLSFMSWAGWISKNNNPEALVYSFMGLVVLSMPIAIREFSSARDQKRHEGSVE
jgi:hypothetical protein